MTLGRVFFGRILLTGIFLVIVFVYERKFGDLPYIILAITVSIIGIGLIINISIGRRIGFRLASKVSKLGFVDKVSSKILIFIWIGNVLSWGYGVLVGLINQVPENLVYRNYFGIIIYLIFPLLLLLLPALKKIFITVACGALIQMVYAIYSIVILIGNPLGALQSSIVRYLYSTGFLVLFPIYAVSMAYFLFPRRKFNNRYFRISNSPLQNTVILLITLITLFSLVIPANSRGFMIALFALSGLLYFVSLSYTFRTGTATISYLIFVLIAIIFIGYLFSFLDIIIQMLSSSEPGNATRSEQYDFIVADLTWWGNGLGSSVAGYNVGGRTYGLELSYFNIMHKLGVFTIFIFVSYFLTIFVAISRMLKGVFVFEAVFVIGLMGYLVVGIGNPLLLSSLTVMLHCIAMYILVSPYVKPL